MAYSTYIPRDELERPQRTALQRALEAMTPPGLVQQGGMLRERFDALGPVRVAERTAEDLTGLFGRLGPISPLDVLSPTRLGARAGAAAGRAVAESEAGVETELRAGATLARGAGDLTAGLSGLPGAAREGYAGFQRGRQGVLEADAQDIGGALGTGLEGLRAFGRGQQEAQRQRDVGFSEAMNRAAQRGGYEDVITPEETKWYREAGENLAGTGPTGNTRNVVDDALGAVGGVVRGGINRLGRRVGRAARAEYGGPAQIVPGRPGVPGAGAGGDWWEASRADESVLPAAWRRPDGRVDLFPEVDVAGGQLVDGREVGENVDDYASVAASFFDWRELPGIREVPMSALEATMGKAPPWRGDVGPLVQEIKASGRIDPIIVRVDKDGAFVHEGQHRFEALRQLGAKRVPALVVVERSARPGALGDAGEALDDVFGIRRGQQIRQPPLTPEQQVQRAADGAAEQRVFDAIRALWRRGPAGEEIADELRFLAVGKGEAGEAAARELLASRGLEDVLPPPTAAGVLPGATTTGEGVLGLARRATEPLGAGAARTPGERAFDAATGTAGGVVGAATAEEDATWQERVGRGALGASLGALGGANLRQLGRVARGALADEALGAVPRSAQTHPEAYPSATGVERQGALPGFREPPQIGPLYRPPGATYPGTRAPAPRPPEPVTPPAGALEEAVPRSGWGVAGDILTSAPLLRPSSLLTNLLGGAIRTFQRWGEESAGAAWVDRAGKESLADLLGMASEAPGAVRDLWKVFRQGGTSAVRGQLGAQSGSLVTEPGWGPMLLTAGTRANLAPDAGWARINTAGAKARAAARGITDPDDVSFLAERSSDFATFAGKASKLTEYLGGFRETLKDPDASGAQKAWALGMVGITPYLRMPERFMAATGRVVLDPAMLGYSRFTKNGLVRQAVEGNQDAQREVAGRLAVSGLAYTLGLGAFAGGQLYGVPPKDAKQRRQMEAAGVRFNTIFGVDTKKLGNFGQAMSAMGTALTAAQRKYEQGADGSDVMRAFFSEAWRWGLEESFLRGLSDFDVAIRAGRGFEHAEKVAADTVTRPLSGIAGYVDPWDPYERERRGTANELLEGLPGGRFLMPTQVDPATGEAVRRRGSGLERMFFGNQGRVESPEARELALRGVTAREFQPADTVYGHVQTPAGRRALQETFGRYTRDYVRDTMARPDYRGATPEEQTATLRRQVGLAQQLADIEVGDRVARDPQARFELEWLRTPHYRGVEGTPERVARQNLEIREAKQLLDEYQRRYGETPGRHRFYDEHPALIDLARRPELPERRQAEEKEAVRRRTGAPETRDTALLGAGSLIVPTPGFTAP